MHESTFSLSEQSVYSNSVYDCAFKYVRNTDNGQCLHGNLQATLLLYAVLIKWSFNDPWLQFSALLKAILYFSSSSSRSYKITISVEMNKHNMGVCIFS